MENQNKRSDRGFWSLIATQFQGSFSDNALKNLVLFLVVGMGLPENVRERLAVLVGALFSIPFILFSMAGGHLADRFSKRSVTIATKIMEIGVMAVALAGLATRNLPVQFAAVFLISTQAALFGPSKYALLPELLPKERLSWGNGILEMGTFAAIITGTMAAGFLAEIPIEHQGWSGAILIGVTLIGLLTSLGIRKVPPAAPEKKFRANFLGDLKEHVEYIHKDRVVFLALIGSTYFWFLGALLQLNIIFYGVDLLNAGPRQNAYLQGALAIGIGIGSLAAGYVSGKKIEYGLIPLGFIGLTVFATVLAFGPVHFASFAVCLALLGFAAGFFAVPINAIIQHRPAPERKGGVQAATNLISFVGIFLGTTVYFLLKAILHLNPRSIFAVSAAMTLAGTIYIVVLLPDSLVRSVLWLLSHSIYRVRLEGAANIPQEGGALLVSNHVSFIDGLLLTASVDRPIRFLLFSDIYDRLLIRPWARLSRAIPISNKLQPRELIQALRQATEAIEAGELVCIFAEGAITRTGQMLPFHRGFERIMKGVDAPIVPVSLDGLWGSIFSFEGRRFFWKMPRHLPYRVTVSFGSPMPATANAAEVRDAVQQLTSEAFTHRKEYMKPLHETFVRTARRHPFRFAMADTREEGLSYGTLLTRTHFITHRLEDVWKGQTMVGILLPPSTACAVVNFAVLLAGKVPVNLNYTASSDILESCAAQCGLKTVLTSKAFLERVPVRVPGKAIFVEDLAGNPSVAEKLRALVMAALKPVQAASMDDIATIIFSSGSTGDPKGVLLTHYNIAANVDQLGQVFAFKKEDRVLGVLPFFHSFGFTGTFALPLSLGVGVVYHSNPLDGNIIGSLARKHKVTFFLATPTFLQAYIQRCSPEDFGSVTHILAGGEKLPDRITQAFEDRFGIRPFEAYGCTECAPAVTVNTNDFRAAGYRQIGAKRGCIGHPLPGISARIVDPATYQPLPCGEPGLLLVRGPNIMKGYLGRPDLTAEVMVDGWYVTGDIATLDEDGFLAITDRLNRFSKIGAEMVPHIKIEDKLHELAGAHVQTFAVTSVPDERKGERLVVLHTLEAGRVRECIEKLGDAGLPNLWLPRDNAFFHVPALPYLGSGKMDLRKIRQIALEMGK